ncbi:MAG: MMPL family transporter [Planctomycetaceae bacterium]
MASQFYRRHRKTLLAIVLITFPIFAYHANTLPTNNDVETWLPKNSEIRSSYDQFKREFGNEEIILIGLKSEKADPKLVEAVCRRIEKSPDISRCWSADRLRLQMREMEVSEAEIESRLQGFVVSRDKSLQGVIAVISPEGLKNRSRVVRGIRQQLRYCQLGENEIALAGSPVVVAELDRLGNAEASQKYFLVTLFISLVLLYYSIRQWSLTLTILGLTVWAINLTMTIMKFTGGESNFILGAIPVMVMVFTLAICIHLLQYYQTSLREKPEDPLGHALHMAWKPCFLATLTTTIGLISLTINDIGPVRQFGIAASIGSLVALVTGLVVSPAALYGWSPSETTLGHSQNRFHRFSHALMRHCKPVAVCTGLMVAVTMAGLVHIRSQLDPLDFLPRDSKVLADMQRVENQLVNLNSVEVVVDLGERDMPFVEKLAEVRRIESIIQSHPNVQCTISPTMFFPKEMPDGVFETADLLSRAQQQRGETSDYLADGDRIWRISARMSGSSRISRSQTLNELAALMKDEPVTLTGISPLLEEAQQSIFEGFWESFAMAFGVITLVMIISLRSLKTGLVAMIPNFTPICIVFGTLGWLDIPVDIGMMMTASIALGIAVDGTFHFLVHYEKEYRETRNSPGASLNALLQTGAPIFKAAMIAALGMLALTLSPFSPTARFGFMMAMLLIAAVIGDLVLLPAVLGLRPDRSKSSQDDESPDHSPPEDDEPGPHFVKMHHVTAKLPTVKLVSSSRGRRSRSSRMNHAP